MKFKFTKKNLTTLAYVGIVGGLALLGLVFFNVSQYEKAKYNSSSVILTGAQSQIKLIEAGEIDEVAQDKLVWYKDIADHFETINVKNANAYKGTAIPAYLFTTLALISFGLCLKHADKVKEKEEQD